MNIVYLSYIPYIHSYIVPFKFQFDAHSICLHFPHLISKPFQISVFQTISTSKFELRSNF